MPSQKKKSSRKTLSKLPSQEQTILLKNILTNLQSVHHLSFQEILDLSRERPAEDIPISIFHKKIGCLEAIAKYYRENKKLPYHEIAKLLNRDHRTIWTTYQKAKKKLKTPLPNTAKFSIPLTIIASRKHAVLESIVKYLRENYGLSFSHIAKLLQRDPRTIWTTYQHTKKKT